MHKDYVIVEKSIDELSSKELDMVYDFLCQQNSGWADNYIQNNYIEWCEQDFIDATEFFLKTTGMRLMDTCGYNLSDTYYQFKVGFIDEERFIENHADYMDPVSNGVWVGEDFETVWAPYRTKMIDAWKKIVDAYNSEEDQDWEYDPTWCKVEWVYNIDNEKDPIALWVEYVSQTLDEVHSKFANDVNDFLDNPEQVKEYIIDHLLANFGDSVVYFRKDFVNGEEVVEVFDTDLM